jgi:hypothetical protein
MRILFIQAKRAINEKFAIHHLSSFSLLCEFCTSYPDPDNTRINNKMFHYLTASLNTILLAQLLCVTTNSPICVIIDPTPSSSGSGEFILPMNLSKVTTHVSNSFLR